MGELRLGKQRVLNTKRVIGGRITDTPGVEEGHVVRGDLANIGEIKLGLNSGLNSNFLQFLRGANSRQLEELGSSESSHGQNDFLCLHGGAIRKLDASGFVVL